MSKRMKSNLFLLLTAFIWGSAFVAQKVGADVGTFTFNGVRTFVAGLSLMPVILILDNIRKKKKNPDAEKNVKASPLDTTAGAASSDDGTVSSADSGTSRREPGKSGDRKVLWAGGISCGLALFVASTLQQYGIGMTTAGKSGFITSVYCIIVPIISIVIGHKVKKIIWLCAIVAIAGLYLLTMKPGESFHIQRGDFFVLLCAFGFALHIMVIDHFSPKTDSIKMSCIQFLVSGLLGIICMFVLEEPHLPSILANWFPILYAGVFSGGMAYTLQIVAQADANPSEASLILCLESVFSVITGAIILHESMSARGYMGCLLIFAAVVLSQLPSKKERLGSTHQ